MRKRRTLFRSAYFNVLMYLICGSLVSGSEQGIFFRLDPRFFWPKILITRIPKNAIPPKFADSDPMTRDLSLEAVIPDPGTVILDARAVIGLIPYTFRYDPVSSE